MKIKKNYNDFELLYLISESNEEASTILYEKYKDVIDLKAKKYLKHASLRGLDYQDLVQEGMIGLSQAVRDFKNEKDVKFSTFAGLCIEREISSAIRRASRQKYKMLNESVSYDHDDKNERPWIEILADVKDKDPYDYVVEHETSTELFKKVNEQLTDFEQQVFDLKLNHFDYKEMSDILGKSYKSIDSAMQRIKNKIKKMQSSI